MTSLPSAATGRTVEDLERELLELGRNEGPAALWWWWECASLPGAHLRALLPGVWVGAEWPAQLGKKRWLAMFEATGFVSDRPGAQVPESALTIYRGALGGRVRGLSWTTDLERARWFAERIKLLGRTDAAVVAAEVHPRHVLATFDGRQEAEVVVKPRGLRNLREVH